MTAMRSVDVNEADLLSESSIGPYHQRGKQTIIGEYDFAKHGTGSPRDGFACWVSLVGGEVLPKGAVITDSYIDVITPVTMSDRAFQEIVIGRIGNLLPVFVVDSNASGSLGSVGRKDGNIFLPPSPSYAQEGLYRKTIEPGGAMFVTRKNYAATVLADQPNCYWRLADPALRNDGRGVWRDIVGGAHADPFGQSPSTITRQVAGLLVGDDNLAAQFNGLSSDLFLVGSVPVLNLGDVFTLEAWIRRGSLGEQVIVQKQGSGAYQMDISPTNRLRLVRAGILVIVESTIQILDLVNPHHVVATKNGVDVHLYIDGVDVTGTVTNQTFTNTASSLVIGRGIGLRFNGVIDEVALYATALAPANVLKHFNVGSGDLSSVTTGFPTAGRFKVIVMYDMVGD